MDLPIQTQMQNAGNQATRRFGRKQKIVDWLKFAAAQTAGLAVAGTSLYCGMHLSSGFPPRLAVLSTISLSAGVSVAANLALQMWMDGEFSDPFSRRDSLRIVAQSGTMATGIFALASFGLLYPYHHSLKDAEQQAVVRAVEARDERGCLSPDQPFSIQVDGETYRIQVNRITNLPKNEAVFPASARVPDRHKVDLAVNFVRPSFWSNTATVTVSNPLTVERPGLFKSPEPGAVCTP